MLDKATARGTQSAAQAMPAFMFPGFVFDMWGPALACNAALTTKLQEGFATLGSEWQDFVSRRMQEDLGLLQLVGSSQAPEQAWGAYITFWQKAVEDYAQESVIMTKLAAQLMNSSIAAMQRRMEEAATEALPFAKAA